MIGDSLRISWNSPDKVISVTEVESPSNTTSKTEGFTGPSGTMGRSFIIALQKKVFFILYVAVNLRMPWVKQD